MTEPEHPSVAAMKQIIEEQRMVITFQKNALAGLSQTIFGIVSQVHNAVAMLGQTGFAFRCNLCNADGHLVPPFQITHADNCPENAERPVS